jgi:hypothetical protein
MRNLELKMIIAVEMDITSWFLFYSSNNFKSIMIPSTPSQRTHVILITLLLLTIWILCHFSTPLPADPFRLIEYHPIPTTLPSKSVSSTLAANMVEQQRRIEELERQNALQESQLRVLQLQKNHDVLKCNADGLAVRMSL